MIISNLNQHLKAVNALSSIGGVWSFRPTRNEALAGSVFLGHDACDGCLMVQQTGNGFFVKYWYTHITNVLYGDFCVEKDEYEYRKKLPKPDGEATLDSFDALVDYAITAVEEWEACPSKRW